MSTAGHPDWTPAIRGYAGGPVLVPTAEVVAAGNVVTVVLPAATLYDVNVVECQLPPGVLLSTSARDDNNALVVGPMELNPNTFTEAVNIPVRSRGGDIVVTLTNFTAVDLNVTLAVKGFNGIPLPELKMPPTSLATNLVGVGAGATATGPGMRGLGVFDRVAWVAQFDRAFSVIARWQMTGGGVLVPTDEVLASGTGPDVIHGALDVAGAGLVLGVRNDGAAGGGGLISARAFHHT